MRIRNTAAAIAVVLAGALALPTKTAHADDLGCKVFLCFGASAIGGWQKVQECVPPVQTALRKMLRGWQPYCDFGSSNGQTGGGAGNFFKTGTEQKPATCASTYGEGYSPSFDTDDGGETSNPRTGTGTRPNSTQRFCENAETGDRRPLPSGNVDQNYIDIYIDNAFYSRTYWDASQAAPDSSVP